MGDDEEVSVKIPRKLEITMINEYKIEPATRDFIKEFLPQVMNRIQKIIEESEKRKVRVRTPPPTASMPPMPPPSARLIVDIPEVEEYLVKAEGITMEELSTYRKISKAVKTFLTKKMEEEKR